MRKRLYGIERRLEKLTFSEQPLDRNHAFDSISEKNHALQAHCFFPCINSEIHKVNCRIAAREGGLGHAPGIYEFAKQIRLNACCRTKHKNRILLFRQAKRRLFTVSFLRFVLANHRIERFQRIRKRADLINQSECGGLIAGDHGADIGGQLTGFAHKLLQTLGGDM